MRIQRRASQKWKTRRASVSIIAQNELDVSDLTVLTASYADFFINNDEYNDARPARHVHPSPLSSHQEDLAELARRLKKRYFRRGPSPFNGIRSSDSSIPSSEQPGSQFWMVQIPVSLLGHFHISCVLTSYQCGLEKVIVQRLSKHLPQGISQVFTLPSVRGRVYVRSECREDVQAALPQAHRVLCVPAEEQHDLISYASRRKVKLPEGSWVRIRHAEHKGDLAIVMQTSHVDDSVSIAIVPRIPMGLYPTRSKQQNTATNLFDPGAVESVYGRGSVTKVQDRYRFQNRTYMNGLLLLNNQPVSKLIVEPHPSLDELIPFLEAQLPAIELPCLHTLKRESIRNVWQRGDRVEVVSGAFTQLWGRLESLDFELWSASVQGHWADNQLSVQDIPFNCLKRCILKGDNVAVVAGRSKERNGIVISSSDGNVTFIDYSTKEEVRYFFRSSCIKSYANIGYGVNVICQVLCPRL
jgi:hypothetical protein